MDKNHENQMSCKNARGFTLVETLVSVAIVGTCAMALTQMSSLSSSQYAQIRSAMDTSSFNQDLAESLLLSTNSESSLTAGEHVKYYDAKGNPVSGDGKSLPSGAYFQTTWTVTLSDPMKGSMKLEVSTGTVRDNFHRKSRLTFYRPELGANVDRTLASRPPVKAVYTGTPPPPTSAPLVDNGQNAQ